MQNVFWLVDSLYRESAMWRVPRGGLSSCTISNHIFWPLSRLWVNLTPANPGLIPYETPLDGRAAGIETGE